MVERHLAQGIQGENVIGAVFANTNDIVVHIVTAGRDPIFDHEVFKISDVHPVIYLMFFAHESILTLESNDQRWLLIYTPQKTSRVRYHRSHICLRISKNPQSAIGPDSRPIPNQK